VCPEERRDAVIGRGVGEDGRCNAFTLAGISRRESRRRGGLAEVSCFTVFGSDRA
jgi:hypothetical protein